MPTSYTPPGSPTFITFPASLPANGEKVNATTFGTQFMRPVIDSLQFLKLDLTEDKGVMSALKTKLGITVTDSSDTALPTYATPFLLTGSKSVKTALETLDDGVQANSTSIVNIVANVGGSVGGASPPVYASSNTIITDGDSHHVAIEKLEDYEVATRALATTAVSDAEEALETATNVAAKVGADAELAAAFNYASQELITNGDTLKECVEILDAAIEGNRIQTDREFSITTKVIAHSTVLGAVHSFYETFLDTSKAHGSSTATINPLLRHASGDGTSYIATLPITVSAPHSQVALVWEITGTVTFSANMTGSLVVGNFTTVGSQLTWVSPATGAGSTLVIRAVISGAGSRIHRLAAFTKV